MIRRALIILLAATLLPLAGPASAQVSEPRADDMVLGRANAPVTVVEYASVTCPHCAHWHEDVFPEFRRRFIETGRVRFVFRELPTAPAPVAVGGFILARCAGPDRYFDVIADLMQSQQAVIAAPYAQLAAIGARHGVDATEFEACINDEAAFEAMNARVEAALSAGVNSTPSFFVDGRAVPSGETLAALEAAIVAAER